jgi:hypothetical protein
MKTILSFVLVILISSILQAQKTGVYRMLFTSRSAVVDTSVKGWRNLSEDKIPRIIKVDLNSDGTPEIIETNYASCSSSGCTWIFKDGKSKKELGKIVGATVYILHKKNNGFNDIETYWKQGFNKATAFFYSFNEGRYKEIKKSELYGDDLKKYFSNKPQFTEEIKELK